MHPTIRNPRSRNLHLTSNQPTTIRLIQPSSSPLVDDCCRVPLRPKPLNIPSKKQPPQPSSDLKAPPPSANGIDETHESLSDPLIVDFAAAGDQSWPQRIRCGQPSPSIASQNSGRPSEISLGILDYYTRDKTPSLYSPSLPPPTPCLDCSAVGSFEFGLPATPTPTPANSATLLARPSIEKTRSQQPVPEAIPLSTPRLMERQPAKATGYSLFPAVKEITPPPRQPRITMIGNPQAIATTPTFSTTGTTLPSPTYRPRKESLSSSMRSRTDSLLTSSGQPRTTAVTAPVTGKRKPLLVSVQHTPTPVSTSASITSPPSEQRQYQSRWSDETTITSPSIAPTPGPRTSFGSLLRRDSVTYPACFFEVDDDDDESDVLLRRKFAWAKNDSSKSTKKKEKNGGGGKCKFQTRETLGEKFARVMLCGGCRGGEKQ